MLIFFFSIAAVPSDYHTFHLFRPGSPHSHFKMDPKHFSPVGHDGPDLVFMSHTRRFIAMFSVVLYSFMSSLMLSCHLFSFTALACLISSWWYPTISSLTRGHTISVASFLYERCHWFDVGFSQLLSSLLMWSFLVCPWPITSFSSQWCAVLVYRFS